MRVDNKGMVLAAITQIARVEFLCSQYLEGKYEGATHHVDVESLMCLDDPEASPPFISCCTKGVDQDRIR